jgi:hypothetical protein
MARNLSAQTGIGTDPNYLNGNLVDFQTLVGEGINQDIVQLLQKLLDLGAIVPNGLPDNETNGYQMLQALIALVNSEAYTKAQSDAAYLAKAQNLFDLPNKVTARNNLGVESAADAVAAYLAKASNLGDLANKATARANLDVLQKSANLSDVPNKTTARTNLDVYQISAADAKFAAIIQPAWANATNLNGATGTLEYYKSTVGITYLKGFLTRGTSAIIANVPAGARPSAPVRIAIENQTASANRFATVGINGDIELAGVSAASDGISFIESWASWRV